MYVRIGPVGVAGSIAGSSVRSMAAVYRPRSRRELRMAKKTKPATGNQIAGKKVMFTGKLAAMTRAQAQSYVTAAGGVNAGSVSKDLDYLVIGDDGSFLYGAGTKGEKTIKAEKLIASGSALKIISETDFLA